MSDFAVAARGAGQDRSAGLIAFGIIHIVLGGLCVLTVLAIAAVSELTTRRGQPAAPMLAQNLLVYGVLAGYFISSGIGSIRARRWSRALILAVSWIWLVSGILSAISMFFWIPRMMVLVPPSRVPVVLGITMATMIVVYLLLPLLFILFYRSPSVLATCVARDPRARWTDRTPLPVLAVVIALAFGALFLLVMLGNPVVPLMDTILTGAPAILVLLGVAGLLAVLAFQLYRLRRAGWWTLLLLQVAGGAVAFATFARLDINAFYERAGIMTPQIRAMHLEQLLRNPLLWTVMVAAWLAYIAFVVWLRRYFDGSFPMTRAEDVRGTETAVEPPSPS